MFHSGASLSPESVAFRVDAGGSPLLRCLCFDSRAGHGVRLKEIVAMTWRERVDADGRASRAGGVCLVTRVDHTGEQCKRFGPSGGTNRAASRE